MRTADTILNIIQDRGKRGLPLEDVYRQLYNPAMYLRAYARIQSNEGAMTPGITEETVDGMSQAKIAKIIEAIRYERWRWTPVRRVEIPKSNGKMRPLGMPTWSDKMVQEVIRSILEAYYEPQFSKHSHGFRPKRGCHTALTDIRNVWVGTKWFIEGDIKGCFDNIDHTILMNILRENIQDNRFLRLIEGALKAGYCEEWTYHPSLSGSPQGGIVSPPTKLQTFFFGIVITRIWVDPKYDIDLVTRDFHPLDQRPDEVALARPLGGLQAVVEFGREVLQPANNQLQCPLHSGLIGQCLALLLEASEAVAQAGHPGFKFSLVDKTLGIAIDQSGDALAQLADLAFNGGQRGTFRTCLRLQAAAIFFREPLGMGEQRTDFLPDCQVQQVGPHLRILTEPLAAKAIRIRAQAAVIGIRAGLACTGTRAEAFAIEGIATVLALEQP